VLLKEGEWSDWVPVSFEMIPYLGTAHGVCRVYLKRCRPDLVLYVSPINIDPMEPATPISTPDSACEDLALAIGRYYTKGMPEETKALQDGVFDDGDFVRQGDLVMEESRKMLAHALDGYKSGLLFFYFSSIDLNCHMMWRHRDPQHPAYNAKLAERYASRIEDLYLEMDHLVGDVRKRLPPDATLIVMSDHGFATFRREMNLNTWLAREGYLVLKDGVAHPEDAEVAKTADWKRSRAYSVGFNGIYLNVAGRESGGIVTQAERHALAEEIRKKLLAEKDPKTGAPLIHGVDLATEVYHGEHVNEAPDILVGFDRGYGASDASCLGKMSSDIIDDHTDLWSGNHLMAADLVPGILLSNRKVVKQAPVLQDITVTILKLFGIDKLPKMTGQSVLEPST
jgi:predicted AlkP superfamily phosphohydrolase/phosphomutase